MCRRQCPPPRGLRHHRRGREPDPIAAGEEVGLRDCGPDARRAAGRSDRVDPWRSRSGLRGGRRGVRSPRPWERRWRAAGGCIERPDVGGSLRRGNGHPWHLY